MSETVSVFHFLHRWTRWTEPKVQHYARPRWAYISETLTSVDPESEWIEVTRVEQTRECEVCGATQMRVVR